MAQELRLAKVASYLGQLAVQMAGEPVMVGLSQQGETYCLTVPVGIYQVLFAHLPIENGEERDHLVKKAVPASKAKRRAP